MLWSDRPESAPVLHVGGPLKMGFEVRAKNAFTQKSRDTFELNVGVGTYGLWPYQFVNTAPSLAMRSMFGVGWPRALPPPGM